MRAIKIKTVVNGYIAAEYDEDIPTLVVNNHVFPTFDALTTWLRKNLDKPVEQSLDIEPPMRVPAPAPAVKSETYSGGKATPMFGGILQNLTPKERGDLCILGKPGCDCGCY